MQNVGAGARLLGKAAEEGRGEYSRESNQIAGRRERWAGDYFYSHDGIPPRRWLGLGDWDAGAASRLSLVSWVPVRGLRRPISRNGGAARGSNVGSRAVSCRLAT